MVSSELIFGVTFVFQCAIGVVGNSLLLMLFVCISFKKPQQKKPIDLILAHLTLANMAALLSRGIPEIMLCFGMRYFLDDLACKALMYIYRVAQGLAVCTTSLLSMFQALIINPNSSVWATIKVRAPRYIVYYFLFFWVSTALIYIRVSETNEAAENVTISKYRYVTHICIVRSTRNDSLLNVALLFGMTVHDLIFHFLMALSITYMVLLLYRHSKQVQHIYSCSHSSKSFPEVKDTQTILLLVTCFVFFHWLNNCITLYETFNIEKDAELETITTVFGGCYPILPPLLLIGSESHITKLHCIPGKMHRPCKNFIDE
ncbi:vomeronasal type-1 receptor 1-like [Trichosurus vulpecula]|uniref:vomeronasal type-1 receptor 1-like n=1 Tax=Trichosurus vulpecula TaxID=9337 RepID=UPI00186AEE62|nr:vomeronasal type-1 receptor 1-like [Trichosurus vulpecula]